MKTASRRNGHGPALPLRIAVGSEQQRCQSPGRRVIGFMSGNQQDPDMMCEVFMLSPTDLVGEHELRVRSRSQLS
jgi:hypothetical protein